VAPIRQPIGLAGVPSIPSVTGDVSVAAAGVRAPTRGGVIVEKQIRGRRSALLTVSIALGTAAAALTGDPARAATDVPYLDAGGTTRTVATAVELDGTETIIGTGPETWYVCAGTLSYAATLTVFGDARLILADGCDLTAMAAGTGAGIDVSGAESLTVYAQSTGPAAGRLAATGGVGGAGIGSGTTSGAGTITIVGGRVEASGGTGGAGIGGGAGRPGGTVVVNGGNVRALGSGGAGIGGGADGTGARVTITGGTVRAESAAGTGGAGIGGGANGTGGRVVISAAADVGARGADGAGALGGGAGIGSGGTDRPTPGMPGTILTALGTGIISASGGAPGASAGAGASFGEGGYAGGDGDDPPFFLVEATAGTGGTVSPSGTMMAMALTDITFTITPDPGYAIRSVTENGVDLGTVTTHTIPGVTGDTTFAADFAPLPTPTPSPTPTVPDAAGAAAGSTSATPGPSGATRLAASGPVPGLPLLGGVGALGLLAGIVLRSVRRRTRSTEGTDR
jgi:hypothetical protein